MKDKILSTQERNINVTFRSRDGPARPHINPTPRGDVKTSKKKALRFKAVKASDGLYVRLKRKKGGRMM